MRYSRPFISYYFKFDNARRFYCINSLYLHTIRALLLGYAFSLLYYFIKYLNAIAPIHVHFMTTSSSVFFYVIVYGVCIHVKDLYQSTKQVAKSKVFNSKYNIHYYSQLFLCCKKILCSFYYTYTLPLQNAVCMFLCCIQYNYYLLSYCLHF